MNLSFCVTLQDVFEFTQTNRAVGEGLSAVISPWLCRRVRSPSILGSSAAAPLPAAECALSGKIYPGGLL